MKILVLNTWSDWPSPRTYLNHREHEIWYACDENGLKFLRNYIGSEEVKGVTLVEKDDVGAFIELMKSVYAVFPFERVVAVDEVTVLPAAVVRELFNVPGPRIAEIELYRDKRKMKERLAQGGIRTIRDIHPASIIPGSFLPCVIKQPDGMAARGVHICRTFAEFAQHRAALEQGAILEEYVAGDCFHVDGAFNGSGFVAKPHAYINNCYEHYVNTKPVGSVGIDDPELHARLVDFARKSVASMPLREGVFHLEIIRNSNDELVFLEIACRIGGGEVYSNFIDTYNFDLLGFTIALQLGLEPRLWPLREGDVAGWLMINDFPHRPGLFNGLRCATLAPDNCMYTMRNYKLGRGVTDRDYVSFAFRGKTSKEVRSSIFDLMDKVALDASPPAEPGE